MTTNPDIPLSADALAAGQSGDVQGRMDRLPVKRLHLAATALCALGFSFDLMEMALGNILSAVFPLPPYGASPNELAWLLSSVYVGAIFGAPLLGRWADRHGRRLLLIAALLWLALTSLAAALSTSAASLAGARLLAGLALGAYPPLMFAYLTDILPPERRGQLTFLTVALGALGPPAGVFLVRALSPAGWGGIEAWRWAFIIGGVGAAVVALMLRRLPESPRWLAVRGRARDAEAACALFERSAAITGAAPSRPPVRAPVRRIAERNADPSHDGGNTRFMPVALLYFLSPWSTVTFPLLIGAVLVNKGFRLNDTLLYVGVSMFGLVIGSALSSGFVDRIPRRLALAGCAAAMTLCGLVFAMSESPAWLIAASTLFTLFSALYVPTLTMYGAEVFPTHSRARLSSMAWAFNRLGAAIAPFVLLPLLHGAGALAMFGVIAVALVGSVVVMWFCPTGYAGRAVR